MTDVINFRELDAPPQADEIDRLREKAAAREDSIGVTFPAPDGEAKRFVVSPRGTCVLLDDTREDTFNRTVAAEDIAETLRE